MSHAICLGGKAYINHIVYTGTDDVVSEPEPFQHEKEGIRFCDGIIVILSADAAPYKEKIKAELTSEINKNPKKHPSEVILNHPLYRRFIAEPNRQAIIIEI